MHPIERLRYVARSKGGDQRMLVRETAGALRGLGLDPAGIVVACRRIVERHPTSGPLWWLCASVVASAEPLATAWRLADEIEADPTADFLVDHLPDDATVALLGWPDLAGEAVLRRGDVTVLAVDVADEGSAFVRRLQRADVSAEIVPASGIGAAAVAADLVLVEAHAVGSSDMLATAGSRSAAAVAYCAEVPVWMVVGRGRVLPEQMFQAVVERAANPMMPWHATTELVPLAMASYVVSPAGVQAAGDASLTPECPMAYELLRASAM